MFSSLRHPNIIQLMGIVVTETKKWIIMELMDFSLNDLLRQRKLDVEEQKSIALSICRGMYHLVSLEPAVHHRDLKSHNLLIENSKPLKVKLTDFGLSRVKTFTMSSLSRVGTTQWSSPEMLGSEEDQNIDFEKSDVYSFGGKL
jgi:serine/threonine protein kinase